MEQLKAVCTARIEQPYLDQLRRYCTVEITGWALTDHIWSEEELLPRLAGAQLLIIGYERITGEMLDKLPQVRLIACCRSNPVNIDVEAARQRGIPVLYTPGRNANAVAEFTIGLMLDLCRNLSLACGEVKAGSYLGVPMAQTPSPEPGGDVIWELPDVNVYALYKGMEVSGRTLGLIGYGFIGSLVAQKARALGMRVLVCDPFFSGDPCREGITLVTLPALLRESDFVSLHCKETPETRGMLSAQEFGMMKPTAYLINTARAAVVNEQALLEALTAGRIAGAALDVFWTEPLPCDHPLLGMRNVLLTPHIGGSSRDVPVFQSRMVVEDILAWIAGGTPAHVYR